MSRACSTEERILVGKAEGRDVDLVFIVCYMIRYVSFGLQKTKLKRPTSAVPINLESRGFWTLSIVRNSKY
jgi:hypothetical protein